MQKKKKEQKIKKCHLSIVPRGRTAPPPFPPPLRPWLGTRVETPPRYRRGSGLEARPPPLPPWLGTRVELGSLLPLL